MNDDEALASATYDVEDAFAANELFQRNGWTDGTPIVPPTESLVRAFLDAVGLKAPDIVGVELCGVGVLRPRKSPLRWSWPGACPSTCLWSSPQ